MAREFITGRQSELLYNEELYKLYEAFKHLHDQPVDVAAGPTSGTEGALWLDMLNGDMKYFDEGIWKLLFGDRFKMIGEILSPSQPSRPVPGQLWLSNGVMMFYNGAEWRPVKAVNVDGEFNLSAFEQFLIINPLKISGDQIVDTGQTPPVLKSQFLLPSTDMDKFFINGAFMDNYERITNVTIQYPTEQLQGKVASAIHVNPKNLTKITKRFVQIDKASRIVPIPESNTEYYAFHGGVGHLLLKSNDPSTEYKSSPIGIELSQDVANFYDFVLGITYEFGPAERSGSLFKEKKKLSGTNSIYVGTMTDPFSVYVQGLFLEDESSNYTYDSSTGYINLTLPSKMDVCVIAWLGKESGIISTLNGTDGVINVAKPMGYNDPIVFVAGPAMTSGLADFTYDKVAQKIYVKNASVGMNYSIVETWDGINPAEKMIVKSGTVDSAGKIPCTLAEFPADSNPILFVDGILVSQRDIIRNVDNSITTFGLNPGQEYTLLKDDNERVIFDDLVSFTTIPTPVKDDALVYIENRLICDSSAVYTTAKPKTGVHGQIKLIAEGGLETWHKFDGPTQKWMPIKPLSPENVELIQLLNDTALGYSFSKKSISILQNFGEKDYTYFAYSFANSVEEPLLRDGYRTETTRRDYNVGFRHLYKTGSNSLNVWLDGIRQYYVEEVDSSTFRFPAVNADPANPFLEADLFYVVEKPESSETKSCEREILTVANRIDGTSNVYQTNNILLYPGNVRVFISGYRQPATAYKIIDSNKIMIRGVIMGSIDNYPVEVYQKPDGTLIDVTHEIADEILVEVRQDFNLREKSLGTVQPGQKEFFVGAKTADKPDAGLPEDILYTKDFIMIYINGAAYGKDYQVNKDRGSIILLNEEVTRNLGTGPNPDIITFEWR